MKTVAFHTLGCRLNIFETDGLASTLEKLGISMVPMESNPNAIVINTCTVTNKADSKNRNIIRNAIKNHPGSQVYVTGCYAETDSEVIQKIPGVKGVFGNAEKSQLPYIIANNLGQIVEMPTNLDRFSYSSALPQGHTRAYLKIQDGCNRVCSYCKIPSARGKGVSRSEADVLDQVQFLQDNGIGEIILTGVNLGWYRDSEGKKSFNFLLEKILQKLEYSRLRISSIEPSDVNSGLADLLSHPRFCKFLHVPLQSGSSRILRLMKRSYTKDTFTKRIELVKNKFPNLFLGTDIITGFPTETESDFQETVQLVKDLGIHKIHAFPYSERKGTLAAEFKDDIPKEVKKFRVNFLNQLSNQNYFEYANQCIGSSFEGIVEKDYAILTDNYLKIQLVDSSLHSSLVPGQFVTIRPTEVKVFEEVKIWGKF
jgi:threonylcarbamoyladenosine tRNA methylthiotransferase MtaB